MSKRSAPRREVLWGQHAGFAAARTVQPVCVHDQFRYEQREIGSFGRPALAELKKVGDEGPTAAAFDKVKEFLQKSYAQSIKENGYWLGQLTSFYRYGTDSHTEYLKTLNAITPEDIARLAKKISDSPNRVEVVMNGIAKQE